MEALPVSTETAAPLEWRDAKVEHAAEMVGKAACQAVCWAWRRRGAIFRSDGGLLWAVSKKRKDGRWGWVSSNLHSKQRKRLVVQIFGVLTTAYDRQCMLPFPS